MSDFSDKPFVAGVLTGLRAFRVDALGRLTGVTYKDVWTPGENVAQCHRSDISVSLAAVNAQVQAMVAVMDRMERTAGFDRRGRKRKSIPKVPTPAEKAAAVTGPAHSLAGITCSCGFYAYFDGGNDYLTDVGGGVIYNTGGLTFGPSQQDNATRIAAIVNAWGSATVGSRGFRAEKAEVVALIVPKSTQARHEVAFSRARRNYPDVQVFETEKDAVRAFPLTDAGYSPETDPDFWTRSAS